MRLAAPIAISAFKIFKTTRSMQSGDGEVAEIVSELVSCVTCALSWTFRLRMCGWKGFVGITEVADCFTRGGCMRRVSVVSLCKNG